MGNVMRGINIFVALFIACCNIYVSFNHSLELFRSKGFTGGLEWGAVLAVEATFLLGGLNIVVARLKNVPVGIPAKLGGVLGVILVSWSNAAAVWDYGWQGVALGLSTPISLVIAEAILSHAILQSSKGKSPEKKEELENLENLERQENLESSRQLESQETFQGELESSWETPKESLQEEEDLEEWKEEPLPTLEEELKASQDSHENLETPKMEKLEKESLENSKEESLEKETPGLEKKESLETSKEESKEPPKLEMEKSPYEVALAVYQETGEFPGRNKLMELTGCSEWTARKTLKELKEKYKKSA